MIFLKMKDKIGALALPASKMCVRTDRTRAGQRQQEIDIHI